MKTTDKLLKILKEEGGAVLRGTLVRDVQKGNVTQLDERLENFWFMRGVVVLPAPRTQLWYLEKDGEGRYCEVSSAKFIAMGRDCVVLSKVDSTELIAECAKYYDCQSDVFVHPQGDVFETEEEAKAELARRSAEGEN